MSKEWRVLILDGGLPLEEFTTEKKARKVYRGATLSVKAEVILQQKHYGEWITRERYKPGIKGYFEVNKGWLFLVWGVMVPFILLCSMLVGKG